MRRSRSVWSYCNASSPSCQSFHATTVPSWAAHPRTACALCVYLHWLSLRRQCRPRRAPQPIAPFARHLCSAHEPQLDPSHMDDEIATGAGSAVGGGAHGRDRAARRAEARRRCGLHARHAPLRAATPTKLLRRCSATSSRRRARSRRRNVHVADLRLREAAPPRRRLPPPRGHDARRDPARLPHVRAPDQGMRQHRQMKKERPSSCSSRRTRRRCTTCVYNAMINMLHARRRGYLMPADVARLGTSSMRCQASRRTR